MGASDIPEISQECKDEFAVGAAQVVKESKEIWENMTPEEKENATQLVLDALKASDGLKFFTDFDDEGNEEEPDQEDLDQFFMEEECDENDEECNEDMSLAQWGWGYGHGWRGGYGGWRGHGWRGYGRGYGWRGHGYRHHNRYWW